MKTISCSIFLSRFTLEEEMVKALSRAMIGRHDRKKFRKLNVKKEENNHFRWSSRGLFDGEKWLKGASLRKVKRK